MAKKEIIYIVQIDGVVQTPVYTDLKNTCAAYRVSYGSATKGKTIFIKDGQVIRIIKSEVIKVPGRGKKPSWK